MVYNFAFLLSFLFSVLANAGGAGGDYLFLKPSSDPTTASEGLVYYKDSTDTLKFSNGLQLITILDASAAVTVSNKTYDNTNTYSVKDTLIALQDNGDATKQFSWEVSGVTAGQNRVMTVPNFNFTPATLAGTETWSGVKTVTDSSFLLSDNGDLTKQGSIDTSGVTAGQNRVLSWPNFNWTPVTLTGTESISGAKTHTNTITMNAQNEIRYADSDSSNYVGWKSAATVGANVIYTLPSASGAAGTQLQTDANGVLSWQSPANILASSISDSDTTHAPDGNSVFDALALKTAIASWHTCTVYVTNAGTPSVTTERGLSTDDCVNNLTDNGVGDVSVNYQAGVFATGGLCTVTPNSASDCSIIGGSSTSAVRVYCYNTTTGAVLDTDFTVNCGGK